MKRYKAFSLIEISVVFLIIGILIAGISQGIDLYGDFVISNVSNLTKNSRVNRIGDLEVWLETTQKDSFSKSEIVEGGTINQWFSSDKKKLNGPSVVGGGNKAIYKDKEIGNLPALFFNGSGWFNINGVQVLNGNSKTIFIVFKTENYNQRNYIFDNAACTTQYCMVVESSSSKSVNMFAGTSSLSGNIQAKKPYIVTAIYNGASSFVRYNGVQSAFLNAGSNSMSKNIRIGASCTSSGENFIGSIGEFIVFDRILSSNEYLDIEKYLSKKWSIDLR